MVHLVIIFGKETFGIEADTNETVEVFRMQVFSVTGIELESQILIGLGPTGVYKVSRARLVQQKRSSKYIFQDTMEKQKEGKKKKL